MIENKKNFAGKDGFIWWTGVIEDRQDPLKLGRCRVRCVGWHSANKMELPTNSLPWAVPSIPVNSVNVYTPNEGDMVFGFFLDAENAQQPVMLGSFPSIPLKAPNNQDPFNDPRTDAQLSSAPRPPKSKTYKTDGTGIQITEESKASLYPNILDEPTTSRIARNDSDTIQKTFIQERKTNVVKSVPTYNGTWNEPETKYGTKYPYNNVTETESGHIMEFDDTVGKERIHLAHRNGSFQEWFPAGDKVEKVTKDNYEIVMGNDRVYIMGKCFVTVQGDAEVYVKKNAFVKVDENVTALVGKNVTATVKGDVTATVDGNLSGTIRKNATLTVSQQLKATCQTLDISASGSASIRSGGVMTIRGSIIRLN
jgi:hypothetical protein